MSWMIPIAIWAASALGDPPTPSPIFGNTYVNTNTSSRGCMIVRIRKVGTFLRSTWRSRRSNPTKALRAAARAERNPMRSRVLVVFIPADPSR
jgi:hypothetical protein